MTLSRKKVERIVRAFDAEAAEGLVAGSDDPAGALARFWAVVQRGGALVSKRGENPRRDEFVQWLRASLGTHGPEEARARLDAQVATVPLFDEAYRRIRGAAAKTAAGQLPPARHVWALVDRIGAEQRAGGGCLSLHRGWGRSVQHAHRARRSRWRHQRRDRGNVRDRTYRTARIHRRARSAGGQVRPLF